MPPLASRDTMAYVTPQALHWTVMPLLVSRDTTAYITPQTLP